MVGDADAVKDAVEIISLRLRESQHRDRSPFPEQFLPLDDDFIPQRSKKRSSASMDGDIYGSRLSTHLTSERSNYYSSRSGHAIESSTAPLPENLEDYYEELVFRILCPVNKINVIVGESDGIMELLQNDIGVDVKVTDHIAGADEQIIIISSVEVFPLSFSL